MKKESIFRVHLHFRKVGMILNQMYLTCNSFSPGTHEGCKWSTFTLLEINNLYLWENCTRWKQNMCGFVKCYNFTADVKNFIWDIWSNSASKFNHPPLADNTSVNTSVAYLSSLNLKWENTGLLWLFSEAKNLFLKVFLEGHSLFFSSFKLLENDFSPSEITPFPLPLTLENALICTLIHQLHIPHQPFLEWKRCWMPGVSQAPWLLILYYRWSLSTSWHTVCFLNTFISSSSFLK